MPINKVNLSVFVYNDSRLLMFQRSMRIHVNKNWRVYLDFGRAGCLSLQLY